MTDINLEKIKKIVECRQPVLCNHILKKFHENKTVRQTEEWTSSENAKKVSRQLLFPELQILEQFTEPDIMGKFH